jgi:HAD superfamily hydrolase (TIGR01509 family)
MTFKQIASDANLLSYDVHLLIKSLADFPLALVTSSPRIEVDAILAFTGLLRHFRVIVSREDVQRPKPDAEPYLLAQERLGIQGGFAFEDSESGIQSASSAGLHAVRVADPSKLEFAVRRTVRFYLSDRKEFPVDEPISHSMSI